MQYGVFQPKPEDCFVATISSSNQSRMVLTESLYFDIKKRQFFILIEEEPRKRTSISPYHDIRFISESDARNLFAENDERLPFLKQFLTPARCKGTSTNEPTNEPG
jgi:hypothetical protein